MVFTVKALQFLLSISILVVIHEIGHFFFAKLFKVRVEKFYLFFNPWFSLFKIKKGETEYGLGWLPLGGYVKIAGMVDESLDREQMAKPPQPYEFRSQSVGKRFFIMIGGVMLNLLAAFFIFWLILFKWGEEYIPAEYAKYGFDYHPIAHEIGLQDGDRVLKTDNHEIETVRDIFNNIILNAPKTMTVLRGDSIIYLTIPDDYAKRLIAQKVNEFAAYRFPAIVDSVPLGSNAYIAGLQKNDQIISINDIETESFTEFRNELSNNKETMISLGLFRNGEFKQINCEVTTDGTIGFYPKHPGLILGYAQITYGFWEALPVGISRGITVLVNYVKQFRIIFSKEGAQQLGGFGTIGNLFDASWNWHSFWYYTGLLSVVLAFMNILPIPALDGGHLLFLGYEAITRKKPGDKFLERAQIIGMIFLLAVLIYANGNDIVRWLAK